MLGVTVAHRVRKSSPPGRTSSVRARGRVGSASHIPGLDGLRALAVLGVILYHANHSWLPGGYIGVEVFFVISGYLITMLLVREAENSGRINLGRFWLRRARRLLPALAVVLVAVAAYMMITDHPAQARVRGDFVAAAGYFSNWYQIYVGQGYGEAQAFVPLRHLWSLAVEEQFYLLWPLVMLAVLKAPKPVRYVAGAVFAGLALVSAIVMGVLYVGVDVDTLENCALNPAGYWRMGERCLSVNDALYLGTFTRASGLLLGAALAIFWRPEMLVRGGAAKRPERVDIAGAVGVLGLVVVAATMWLQEGGESLGTHFNPFVFRGGMLLVDVLTLLVVAAVTLPGTRAAWLIGNPVLTWVGTRSYGLYLYHWPIFQVIRQQAGTGLTPAQAAAALTVTVAIGEVSYRFVELPVRRGALTRWWRVLIANQETLTRRIARGATGAVALSLLVIGADTALAQDRCATPTECAIAQGAAVKAAQPGPQAPPTPSAPITASDPGPAVAEPTRSARSEAKATPGTPAPTPTPTPAVVNKDRPVAIGESVMQEAVGRLESHGVTTNAEKSRNASHVIAVLEQLKGRDAVPHQLVIQVGTNSVVTDADFDTMMSLVPADTKVHFVTVRAPGKYIGANNARIRALPQRFVNVTIVDWEAESHQTKLCPDGVHTSCAGGSGVFYTNLILTALGLPT